jgi:hypothetical protein
MFLKNFSEFNKLNELVSNEKLLKHYISDIFKSLKKFFEYDIKLNKENYSRRTLKYTVDYIDNSINKKRINSVIKFLQNKQEILINKGVAFSFRIGRNAMNEEPNGYIFLYIKDLYTGRIKPPRYLYHTTLEHNVNNILKNGLKTINHSKGRYKYQLDLYYPKSIFAMNVKEKFMTDDNTVLLKIDTTKINNKWYKDLNLHDILPTAVMTFEDIPPEAISLD